MMPYMKCSNYGMDFTQEAFDKALDLIEEAVQDERADELRYDYLISVAPTQEEKDIIASIRNDERNHRQWFREIYKYYTDKEIESKNGEEFVKPATYLDGISKAVFGELGALEKYRFIREGLPSRLYRDTIFRILTDEMKHATKYDYILSKNSLKQGTSAMATSANMKMPTP
jgi:rubrerythrin